ncbi:MAG: hypothetical protein COB67_00455 [SAR324 cluster bacterium]|uniref:Serine dehydrogenasease n=1 Tax=SAR324 cluster bacterium TaxID=2024889 RepID=A0A2A4TCC5_9DELT|nr:MAG: hypothetical protein COB67_00455 [SAR324 cluster bacterium]
MNDYKYAQYILKKYENQPLESFSFSWYNNEHQSYASNTYLMKGSKINNIMFESDWIGYESIHGVQEGVQVLVLLKKSLKKLAELRGKPVVLYFSATEQKHFLNQTRISVQDVKDINEILYKIPESTQEIDFVINSSGGDFKCAFDIVELLQARFKKVTCIVPDFALSAASAICLMNNEIILSANAKIGPIDPLIESYLTKEYISVYTLWQSTEWAMKNYTKHLESHQNYNMDEITKLRKGCSQSIQNIKKIVSLYILIYMFNIKNVTIGKLWLDKWYMPLYMTFNSKGRKAKQVTNFFINWGRDYGHDSFIPHSALYNMGLNIAQVSNEILETMQEISFLSHKYLLKSDSIKIHMNSEGLDMGMSTPSMKRDDSD